MKPQTKCPAPPLPMYISDLRVSGAQEQDPPAVKTEERLRKRFSKIARNSS